MNRKYDIKYCKIFAKMKSGRCLSKIYVNTKTKILWKCKNNHTWEAMLATVKDKNSWCPICAIKIGSEKRKLDGLKIAKQIAEKHNGVCLSTGYINIKTKMKWQCKNNHIWQAHLNSVKNKTWCPECFNISRSEKLRIANGLEIAQEISKNKYGLCLSTKYINVMTKMLWKCKKGHIWETTLHHIKNNHWCPECGYLQAAKNSNNSCILFHWKTNEEIVCVASYEKKVIEYLNLNKVNYKWQHKTFNMILSNGKKTTYRPDLYLVEKRNPWVEIKGYFRDDAKEKWNIFHSTIKPNSQLWDEERLKELKIL